MLDYETDEDAHFQCPECGQKGSVPKATIEKALAETPHVHISCSNCAHKFEPFAPTEEPAEEESKQAMPSPLEAHWAQHDDEEDGGAADEEMADGNLPGWMMPVERPQTETSEPQEAPEENDTHSANGDDDEAVDEAANEELDEVKEAALDVAIADDMASKGVDDPLDGPIADASPDASPDPMPDAPDDEVDEADEVSDEVIAADKSQESETEQAPQPTQEPIAEPTPAPSPAAPQIAATIDTPPVKGPTGILNRLLGGLVLLLLAASTFVFIANRDTAPPALSPSTLSRTNIELQNAGFVRFSEDGEAGIEVSIRFKNPSAQIGIIDDFRIELQNEAGVRLVHWTILSTGETVAPGQTRTLTSVLFGPPAGLARVNIVYPLDD